MHLCLLTDGLLLYVAEHRLFIVSRSSEYFYLNMFSIWQRLPSNKKHRPQSGASVALMATLNVVWVCCWNDICFSLFLKDRLVCCSIFHSWTPSWTPSRFWCRLNALCCYSGEHWNCTLTLFIKYEGLASLHQACVVFSLQINKLKWHVSY